MTYTLIVVVAGAAVVNWLAVARKWRPLEYVSKPLVMLLLLAWLWQAGSLRGWMLWFAAGVVFSLAGDILLMLPRDLFVAGLASFLLAGVAYIVGFNPTFPPINPLTFALAAAVGLVAWRVHARICAGLRAREGSAFAIPVLAYSIVLTLMVLSALLTFARPEWHRLHVLIVSCGAVSFLVSDSLLAWDRFVVPLSHASLKVMVTYHLGQIGILAGAALHFLS
jgi:uncharacterized membrane protein YhhN